MIFAMSSRSQNLLRRTFGLTNSQGSLLAFEDDIRRALNVVFTGF